ncbi:membrane protein [Mesorhizobium sp. LSJC269B00]|uniref:membrane protein n=1 Tax=Mesorhizobium sp. LSJC269B00 TaxID=1287326 RepID=UPI0003CECAA3|nr:membrane protein [Mesorhizobium sp. LSJC269B00]ESW90521.1 membrane protein [Mesorhizobium sp. LSJC269B00]
MAKKRGESFLGHPSLPLFVFATLTLGGCVFIAIAKLSGADPIMAASAPVCLMLIYLAASVFTGKLRLHDEQTGDNLYYMGFLFTLTSLGVSLFQFGSEGSTDTIVRNFGIAVTSTITGIALRIFYNQMRRDPADIERTVRHELADMTRRVRAEMESVTREFADFRRVSNQMLEEGFAEIAVQAERNGEHIRSALDKIAMESIRPVQEASGKLSNALSHNFGQIESQFSSIAQRVEAAADLLDKANSSMSSSVGRLGEQAESVATKLEKVVVPDEVLKNDLAPMVKLLGSAVAQYAVKTETASQEQEARMAGIVDAVAKVAAGVEKAVAAAEQTAESVQAQQRLTQALAAVVQKQSKDTGDLVATLAGRTLHAPRHVPPLNAPIAIEQPLADLAANDTVESAPIRVEPEPQPDAFQTLGSEPPAERTEPPKRTSWWGR